METARKNLADESNKALVRNAEIERDVAELREKVADKEYYSAKQRLKFLDEANALETEKLEINKKIADERLRIENERLSGLEKSEENETKLAELTAERLKTETEYFSQMRSLTKSRQNLLKEIASDEKTANDERIAKQKEYLALIKEQNDKQREAIRAAEDAAFAVLDDSVKKRRELLELSHKREIEDLRRRYDEEERLTPIAKQAILDKITSLEEKHIKDMAHLSDENIAQQIEKEQKRIELELSAIKSGFKEEHKLRLAAIEQNRKSELLANSQLIEEMRQDEALINAKYNEEVASQNEAYRKQLYEKQSQQLQLEWQNRLLKVREGSLQEYDLKVQATQAEYNAIESMDAASKEAMYGKGLEADTAYTNALLENKRRLQNAEIELQKKIADSSQKQIEITQILSNAFSDMLNSFAEDNESLAGFAKAIALFNIGLSIAEAIAAAVASAAEGDPYTYALRVAAAIAAVMAAAAKAYSVLNQQKQPRRPSFSKGGVVEGEGSGTSDSVTANVSNGESILTAKATKMFAPFLSAFN